MSFRIQSNVDAMASADNLARTQTAVSKSIQRLSTGFRINSAADDAAGLSISERMRGQIRGIAQATKNANDGISMLQTGEGALNGVHDMLQRVRELAVEYHNGSLSTADRTAIQSEVNQLASEIQRVGTQTSFNGTALLNAAAPLTLQIGANDGEMLQDFLRVFPAARVVAFEPYAPCCEILERKFRNRPNVRIQNVALGAERGTSRLNLYSGNRMNSLLRLDDDPGNVMAQSFAPTGTAEVRVETLDAFCAASDIPRIDILKIDTQGFDLQVLKGAAQLLEARRIKTVLLEVNFVPMYERQASFPELHQLLTEAGYRFVDFYNQRRNDGYTAWCDACYVAPDPTGPGDRH